MTGPRGRPADPPLRKRFSSRRTVMSEHNDPCREHESPAEAKQRQEAEEKVAHEYHQTARTADSGQMPKLDFSTFVMSLSSTVLVHLGEIPDLQTGQAE